MSSNLLNLYARMQAALSNEEGQDLIEYALVVALIALAATTAMTGLATHISTAFSTVGTDLGTYVS